jgi:hypothetical protein
MDSIALDLHVPRPPMMQFNPSEKWIGEFSKIPALVLMLLRMTLGIEVGQKGRVTMEMRP